MEVRVWYQAEERSDTLGEGKAGIWTFRDTNGRYHIDVEFASGNGVYIFMEPSEFEKFSRMFKRNFPWAAAGARE